jgi:molybdopterin-containing oxidoreductase family membrane subunit
MAAGPSLTVFASKIAALFTSRATVNEESLNQIARFVGWVLVAYLYLRFWDTFSMIYTYEPGRTEGLKLLTQGTLSFNFWFGEIILGIIVPMVILINNRLRSKQPLQLLALLLVIGGLIAYRWDTNMVGQMVVFSSLPQGLIPLYTKYTPALIEVVVGMGVIAYALFAFTLGARYLNVVDAEEGVEAEKHVAYPAPAVMTGTD